MSVMEILDALLLGPLELLFEVIFVVTDRLINNPAASIAVLSLAINFLVLPLYRRADIMQESERDMEKKLQKGVDHIKKTFSGDERMLMLQTYYRQSGYKPVYVLRSAVSLFLQIPFFIAAYRFLSGLSLLQGVPFGPVADLASPDGMLQLGDLAVNIMPFIMTAVNLVSCVIFTKGAAFKEKLQLYGMAVFFLIFLYSAPSGLVFYWTLNNIFSLVKTVFYKLKNPGKILNILCSTAGIGIWFYGVFIYGESTPKRMLFFVLLGALAQTPALCMLLKKRGCFREESPVEQGNKKVFLSGGIFLSVLTGVVIPSAVIVSSPQEFVSSTLFFHPLWFVVNAFCLAFGTFVIWMGVFYRLSNPRFKPVLDKVLWVFSGAALLDYMLFGRHFGNLSSVLRYEEVLEYSHTEQIWNILAIVVCGCILWVAYRRFERRVHEILIIGIAAFGIMSLFNISKINVSVEAVREQLTDEMAIPEFTLSKSGKNVIVIMLDRAIGAMVPFIFDEKPELMEQFDGFTYYSNTISFGQSTNFGSPSLFGGYEYTPAEMNQRDKESLVSKHNEALKVLPVLFDENDYKVTVINPVYANYQSIPDLSIYNDYPDINKYTTGDKFNGLQPAITMIENNKRNFFCYGILKVMPLFAQKTVYNVGKYNQAESGEDEEITYSGQYVISPVATDGIRASFMENYNVLENLPAISNIESGGKGTVLIMANEITHEPMLLQEPDYVVSPIVDNTEYEEEPFRREADGRVLRLETVNEMFPYHANMAAMIQLGKWFDFMREEGVYDNTRIILVSDHGKELEALDELILNDDVDVCGFFPLLMVKDFGESGFTTSEAFMTNADVPAIAVDELIEQPVNPFTGKKISSEEKTAHDQYIIDSEDWDIEKNNGTTFWAADWYSIHDNIWDMDNWKLAARNVVLSAEDY